MRYFLYSFIVIVALAASRDSTAEIYKCEDADGGVVFQQTPCPAPVAPDPGKESAAGADEDDADEPAPARPRLREGEDVAAVLEAEQAVERQSAAAAACKQRYRDAIDAIDLEIQNSYTADQREYYLAQLTALTEKMRAC